MARREDRGGDRRNNANEPDSDIVEKLVHINRVAATVKGGRRFSFAALMVVGDQKGRVGFGESRTLHHDGAGRHGAGKVMLRAAPAGTGVIAGGPMRAVLETLGVQDVVAKSVGSSNPYNMVRATFDALKGQSSPRQIASKRGKKVGDLLGRRTDGASVAADTAEG
jgi:small subunit ribosomal protein S5